MTLARNSSTGLLYRITGSGLCYTCCVPYEPEFADDQCCCYLDPDPDAPDWDSGTTYYLYDIVTYSGTIYYCTVNGVTWAPGGIGWAVYTHCDNEDWNSIEGFGGLGKTPKYYIVSAQITGGFMREGNLSGAIYTMNIARKFPYGSGCNYAGSQDLNSMYTEWDVYDSGSIVCSGVDDTQSYTSPPLIRIYSTPQIRMYATFSLSVFSPCTTLIDYTTFRDRYASCDGSKTLSRPTFVIALDDCEMSGTKTADYSCYNDLGGGQSIEEWKSVVVTWVPANCDYSLYSEDVDYSAGDCVAWLGRLWKACKENGPGTAQGVQNPTYTGNPDDYLCDGKHWRLLTV